MVYYTEETTPLVQLNFLNQMKNSVVATERFSQEVVTQPTVLSYFNPVLMQPDVFTHNNRYIISRRASFCLIIIQ